MLERPVTTSIFHNKNEEIFITVIQIKMYRHYQTYLKISNQCMKFSDEELLYMGLLGISFRLSLFQGIS